MAIDDHHHHHPLTHRHHHRTEVGQNFPFQSPIERRSMSNDIGYTHTHSHELISTVSSRRIHRWKCTGRVLEHDGDSLRRRIGRKESKRERRRRRERESVRVKGKMYEECPKKKTKKT